MIVSELFEETRYARSGPRCNSYYCSTCGGQASRVEKIVQGATAEEIFDGLMNVNIAQYLAVSVETERRRLLKHLLAGADFSKPVLTAPQQSQIYENWRGQLSVDVERSLDQLFYFHEDHEDWYFDDDMDE